MKKLIFFIGISVTFLFASSAPKDILLIQSYHKGYKWSDDISKVIEKKFSEQENVFLSTIYMDTKRIDSPTYLDSFYKYYKERFKNHQFDVVIVADNSALAFVKSHYQELFSKSPIVFLGINNYEPEMIQGISKITGVVENVDIKKNIDLILMLHPQLDKLLIINRLLLKPLQKRI